MCSRCRGEGGNRSSTVLARMYSRVGLFAYCDCSGLFNRDKRCPQEEQGRCCGNCSNSIAKRDQRCHCCAKFMDSKVPACVWSQVIHADESVFTCAPVLVQHNQTIGHATGQQLGIVRSSSGWNCVELRFRRERQSAVVLSSVFMWRRNGTMFNPSIVKWQRDLVHPNAGFDCCLDYGSTSDAIDDGSKLSRSTVNTANGVVVVLRSFLCILVNWLYFPAIETNNWIVQLF